ncbi:MAG TPA: hypothetical protein VHX88_00440 [Solirubrobacteraceae bacterium]|jgi:hypothetical protein|nr:hypothetical protein [Solirubrobacteraceae bacterium]
MSGQPAWRRAFDSVERTVGRPLEDAAASSTYVDALVLVVKLQTTLTRATRRSIEKQLDRVLHVAGMPSRRDIRRLSHQLTTLTSEVRTLSTTTEEIHRATLSPANGRSELAGRGRQEGVHDA